MSQPELQALPRRLQLTDVDFQQNDGIVNTRSMSGPDEKFVKYEFPKNLHQVGQLKGNYYWSMGPNGIMDHADEIGVITEKETSKKVETMYKKSTELLDFLP